MALRDSTLRRQWRKFLQNRRETWRFWSISSSHEAKKKQHTVRTSSQQRTALAHLACTKSGEDDQSFQLNLISRQEFFLKSHTNLAFLHFYCCKLFATEIKNNEREDIDGCWRNSILVITMNTNDYQHVLNFLLVEGIWCLVLNAHVAYCSPPLALDCWEAQCDICQWQTWAAGAVCRGEHHQCTLNFSVLTS